MADHVSPNVGNLVIGKGALWVKPFASGAYTHMGNASEVTMEPQVEVLDHYSSLSELRNKDKSVTIQSDLVVTMNPEESTRVNLAKYSQGTVTGDKVNFLEGVTTEYAVKFVSNNPAGPNATFVWHRGTFAPNGALNLISEEYAAMPVQFNVLNDETNNPDNPMGYAQYTTTTT